MSFYERLCQAIAEEHAYRLAQLRTHIHVQLAASICYYRIREDEAMEHAMGFDL